MNYFREDYTLCFLALKENTDEISTEDFSTFCNLIQEIGRKHNNSKYCYWEKIKEQNNITIFFQPNRNIILLDKEELKHFVDKYTYKFLHAEEESGRLYPQWMEEAYKKFKLLK